MRRARKHVSSPARESLLDFSSRKACEPQHQVATNLLIPRAAELFDCGPAAGGSEHLRPAQPLKGSAEDIRLDVQCKECNVARASELRARLRALAYPAWLAYPAFRPPPLPPAPAPRRTRRLFMLAENDGSIASSATFHASAQGRRRARRTALPTETRWWHSRGPGPCTARRRRRRDFPVRGAKLGLTPMDAWSRRPRRPATARIGVAHRNTGRHKLSNFSCAACNVTSWAGRCGLGVTSQAML
jgi:hypothetical protein